MGNNNEIVISITGGTKNGRLLVSHLIGNNLKTYINCKTSRPPCETLEKLLSENFTIDATIQENDLSVNEAKNLIREELEQIKDDITSIQEDITLYNIPRATKKINTLLNEIKYILGEEKINKIHLEEKLHKYFENLRKFKVVCDETNNPPESIKNNELNVDIYFPRL